MSFLDSEKVYTGVGFLTLVEPDISIRSTRKQLAYTTERMQDWNKGYWGWKHGYKKRYSKQFLEKRGYATQSHGQTINIVEENLEAYCIAEIPDYKEMIGYTAGSPLDDFEARFYLQNNSTTWSNRDNLLDDIWVYEEVRYSEDDWDTDQKNKLFLFFHHIDEYVVKKIIEIPNTMEDSNWLTIQYKTNAADDDEWFIFIENKAYVYHNVFEGSETLVLTPIVTLKVKEIIKPDTWNLNRMMRKLNVDANAFEESLNQKVESGDSKGEPAVDSAYLMNGLPLYNPYEVLPGTYKVKDGDNLPYALLKHVEEKQEGIHVITQEDADWYYNKHLKEQAYLARALFKTFAYYSSQISEEYMAKKRPSERFMGKGTVDDFEDKIGTLEEELPTDPWEDPAENPMQDLIDKNKRMRDQSGIVIEQDSVTLTFGYTVKVETFSGKVRPDREDGREQSSFTYNGKRKSAKDEDGKRHTWYTPGYNPSLGNQIIIKVQVDENSYQKMTITNFSGAVSFDTKKSGWRYHDLTPEMPLTESRLPIPLFVLYNNTFREYVTIYEHSLVYLAFSIDIIVVKWYKKFLGVLIAVLVCAYSWGTGCSASIFIYQMIVGMVVTMFLKALLEMIDSDILKILIQFAMTIAQMALGGFDFSAMTSEAFLSLAVNVGTMVMGTFQATALKEEALAKREQDFQDGFDEKMAALDSSMNLLPRMELGAHSSFIETQGSQPFYDIAFGDASLYNYDQYYDVDGEIELRKQVKPG